MFGQVTPDYLWLEFGVLLLFNLDFSLLLYGLVQLSIESPPRLN